MVLHPRIALRVLFQLRPRRVRLLPKLNPFGRRRLLGREVAVKVSTAIGTSELCARFRLEARVIARLEHPGIIPVHDIGVLPDGRLFYVMKLVRGERFDAWVRRGQELRSALRVFVRVCEAVAFAHAHGVVHRDLKPENVMIGEFGGRDAPAAAHFSASA